MELSEKDVQRLESILSEMPFKYAMPIVQILIAAKQRSIDSKSESDNG